MPLTPERNGRGGLGVMVVPRRFVVVAAVVMLVAGAGYARGAAVENRGLYVSGIQVDAKRPNVVYVSTLGGEWAPLDRSVLKSTDGGRTWKGASMGLELGRVKAPSDWKGPLRVDALAMDARSPKVLYAGTGLGVFKTSDGAKTWKLIGNSFGYNSDSIGHRLLEGLIYGLAAHGSTVYAAGGGRLWKSANGGVTWKTALRRNAISVAIDPRRPNTVYAGTISSPGSTTRHGSIYKTVDGGRSWRAVGPAGLNDNYFGHPIVVDPRPPGIVYAGGAAGVFVSANQGRTWSKLLSLQSDDVVNGIALDPMRANVLYASTWGRGLLKSEDGGQTWRSARLNGRSVTSIAVTRSNRQTIYAGVQNDGPDGLFASTDGGATWLRLF